MANSLAIIFEPYLSNASISFSVFRPVNNFSFLDGKPISSLFPSPGQNFPSRFFPGSYQKSMGSFSLQI